MNEREFRALLDALMMADPWPFEGWHQDALLGYAARRAAEDGYDGWIEAYHSVPQPDPCVSTEVE